MIRIATPDDSEAIITLAKKLNMFDSGGLSHIELNLAHFFQAMMTFGLLYSI